MNEVDDKHTGPKLRREAVDWVQRLASGRATSAEIDALGRWRAQSPAHDAAFADASHLWKVFGPAARNLRKRGEISPGLEHRIDPRAVATRRTILGGGIAAASVAAVYGMANPPLGLWPSFAELAADYRTITGEQRQLALPGDISVRLNTQTSVALRSLGAEADQIELIAGEASFVSAPRAHRSLVVLAANGKISANRAHFDVRRTGESVCVTCLGGDVIIERISEATAIGAGQQIRYDRRGLGRTVSVDLELITAWQEGVLIFRLAALSEVVEEINRYRPGKVIVLDSNLARKTISGRFRIDHMDDILVRLDQAFGIKTRSLPGGIVLLT